MKKLKKPSKLKVGDKVALVSLSWGGAGDKEILWRYEQGKDRLEKLFGLKVVDMKYTLAGTDYIYNHPEKRAEDLMCAFQDESTKGIIACIGGNESIRMLPYIDFNIINHNPKVFMGYSDTTTTHLFCLKAGISSIYGPTLLVDFAENVSMHPYTVENIKKTLFETNAIGEVKAGPEWTSQNLSWEESNKSMQREYKPNNGYELLQGKGVVKGRLIGGCMEVFDSLRGTAVYPTPEEFDDSILFLETSEEKPPVWFVEGELRNYGITGILDRINGIIWGKPQDEENYLEYKEVIYKVMKEFNKADLPILYNMNFGHTEPKICLPYGILAEIDCEKNTFSIMESAVI
ncbi:S66 family peptidase [Clostridium estertheticum]|uniref:S66 family peptidase n=1 Tax=Clostridium estertheticum TaxID=238834 RepID=UPI001C0E0E50|nr:S66 peptidase family protein [Clostridium estertheticum]MBU3073091.1 LD-carboxypeptidase [Clostridium estertheticum]MBU3162872.1 LD-carboxypeptidase [Clostridium estertheticum]